MKEQSRDSSHPHQHDEPSDPSSKPSVGNQGQPNALGCPEGPHWTHFVVNPYDDIVADPETGTIRPWYAIKHEIGRTLNFPLNLGNLQINKDLYLAHFVDTRYVANTHFKSFMY